MVHHIIAYMLKMLVYVVFLHATPRLKGFVEAMERYINKRGMPDWVIPVRIDEIEENE